MPEKELVETTEDVNKAAVEAESDAGVKAESDAGAEPAEAPGTPPEMSPEAEAAQAALQEVDEPQENINRVAAAIRARKNEVIQAKDQLIQHLQTELETRRAAETAPVELSPAERYIAENDDFDPDTESLPARVMIDERKWQERQAEQKAAAQQQRQRAETGQTSLARARQKYSDFNEIVDLGRAYLSAGDKLDISMSDDPAGELYRRSIKATLNSGTDDAVMLRAALQEKLPNTSVPPKTTKKEKEEKEQGTEAETGGHEEEEVMSPRMAHMYNAMGL